jgi:hypothetical protein
VRERECRERGAERRITVMDAEAVSGLVDGANMRAGGMVPKPNGA